MASAFVERFSAPRRTGNFILDLHPLVKLNVMISLCALNFLFDSLYGSLGLNYQIGRASCRERV